MTHCQPDMEMSQQETVRLHQTIIEQVIRVMREQPCKSLSLEDMADIARLSPFYFNRVFHRLIGIPPGEFLAALRLDEAKRLLLTTSLNVTEVCFEVGYTSLGSFTTRFTQLVGLSPSQLRHLAKEFVMPSQETMQNLNRTSNSMLSKNVLSGTLDTSSSFTGIIFVGLFPKPIPQGRPICSVLLCSPGPYSIDQIPDGHYYVMAAGFPFSDAFSSSLFPLDGLLVGKCERPVTICGGQAHISADILLRPLNLTDPPLLIGLPFLK